MLVSDVNSRFSANVRGCPYMGLNQIMDGNCRESLMFGKPWQQFDKQASFRQFHELYEAHSINKLQSVVFQLIFLMTKPEI